MVGGGLDQRDQLAESGLVAADGHQCRPVPQRGVEPERGETEHFVRRLLGTSEVAGKQQLRRPVQHEQGGIDRRWLVAEE